MENLGLGLTLMCIGMVTVFAILLIIINLSKLLIKGVNKIAPEEVVAKKAPVHAAQGVDELTMDIIRAAVAQVTGGKGQVGSVERL